MRVRSVHKSYRVNRY